MHQKRVAMRCFVSPLTKKKKLQQLDHQENQKQNTQKYIGKNLLPRNFVYQSWLRTVYKYFVHTFRLKS